MRRRLPVPPTLGSGTMAERPRAGHRRRSISLRPLRWNDRSWQSLPRTWDREQHGREKEFGFYGCGQHRKYQLPKKDCRGSSGTDKPVEENGTGEAWAKQEGLSRSLHTRSCLP